MHASSFSLSNILSPEMIVQTWYEPQKYHGKKSLKLEDGFQLHVTVEAGGSPYIERKT